MMRAMRMAVVAMAAMVSVPVAAQDFSTPVFDMGTITNNAAMDTLRQSEESRARGGGYRIGGRRGVAVGGPRVRAARLTYRPSAERRRQNLARFVAKTQRVDPVAAAKMRKVFASENVIGQMQGWMSKRGLSVSNVADAAAVYLTTAWLAVHGRAGDPRADQLRGVRRQMADAMAVNPQFATAGDATKQEAAEAMLVQAIVVQQYSEALHGNPAMQRKLSAAVTEGARRTFGFDLSSMQLTPGGLE